MFSERIRFHPVTSAALDVFHALVTDNHVRRYLMDGNVFPRQWSEDRIRESEALFHKRGVGIWLARDEATDEMIGFCGFLEIPSLHPEPQLVYAMFERFAGKGYGTEMARAAIAEARRHPGFDDIFATVDEPNVASIRILEKLGFARIASPDESRGPLRYRLSGEIR